MKFKFQITSPSKEVDWLQWKDLVLDLEKYIDSKLSKQSFGSSVETFHYGFELFPFDTEFKGWFERTKDIRRYSWKNKYLLSVGQIDWNIYKKLDDNGRYQIIIESILSSIKKLQSLKKKPKDFDFIAFEEAIKKILNDYKAQ